MVRMSLDKWLVMGDGGKFFGTKKARLRCLCRHRTSSKKRRSSPAGNKLAKKGHMIAEADARSTTGTRGELCTSGGVVMVVRGTVWYPVWWVDRLPFRGVHLALRRLDYVTRSTYGSGLD